MKVAEDMGNEKEEEAAVVNNEHASIHTPTQRVFVSLFKLSSFHSISAFTSCIVS